jgi:cell division transport system permease protein
LNLEQLRATIRQNVTGASVDDHSVWTSRLSAMAGTVVAGGFAIMLLVMGSMVLSVVFATQAAMAGNKDVVSVLHFVGAEDTFIAREFQRHFLVLGLKGGVSGGLASIVCFVFLDMMTRQGTGQAGSDQLSALFGSICEFAGLLRRLRCCVSGRRPDGIDIRPRGQGTFGESGLIFA